MRQLADGHHRVRPANVAPPPLGKWRSLAGGAMVRHGPRAEHWAHGEHRQRAVDAGRNGAPCVITLVRLRQRRRLLLLAVISRTSGPEVGRPEPKIEKRALGSPREPRRRRRPRLAARWCCPRDTTSALMSTIWERYRALPQRQRVLFGVIFVLGGSVGLWLEERTQVLPSAWLPSSRGQPAAGPPS